MSRDLEFMLSLIGSILEGMLVELYRYDEEFHVTINDVQLNIGNTKFVFGCSGDGSVFVKKGEAALSSYGEGIISSKLYALDRFSGYRIENIEVKDASIVINLSSSRLEIINDDDELVIMSDGERLFFDTVI